MGMVINIKTKDEVKKYLPKHPMDNYHINEIMELNDDDFKVIKDDLFIWMKNMQHPVSIEIAAVFTKRHIIIKESLVKSLNNELVDSVFKYNIIKYIISSFSKKDQQYYEVAIERIAKNPTKEELYAEVDVLAKTYIEVTT